MKEKQLRLVNANFLNNLYKGDYDNVFYDKENDNVEYYLGLPYIKIWTNASGKLIRKVKLDLSQIDDILYYDIKAFVNTNNIHKSLYTDGLTYIRLTEFDLSINDTQYYAWLDSIGQYDIIFTEEDYNIGDNVGDLYMYEGNVLYDDEASNELVVVGADYNTQNMFYNIKIVNYVINNEDYYFDAVEGKRIKTQDGFTFNVKSNGRENNPELTKIEIFGCEILGSNTFARTNNLTSVIIHEGMTKIHGAFLACGNLSELTLPSTVTSMNHITFNGCKALTSIKFEGNMSNVPTGYPWGASNLTQIICKDGTLVI